MSVYRRRKMMMMMGGRSWRIRGIIKMKAAESYL